MSWLCEIIKYFQKNKKTSGISLIELVLVITMLALLTGISVLHFTTVSTYGAGRDLHKMVDDIIYLRKYALRNRTKTKFVIVDGGYQLHIGDETYKTIALNKALVYDKKSNRKQFVFSENGRPIEAGTMVFTYGSNEKKIVVQPVNGRVSLQEVEYE